MFNWAHVHLFVNDVPLIGLVFASTFFAIALAVREGDHWVRAGMVALALAAGGTVLALLTGNPALEVISGQPRTSGRAVTQHHIRATVGSILAGLTLAVAFAAWFQRRKTGGSYSRRWIMLVLSLTFASAAAMGLTSAAGGRINHPEVQEPADQQSAPAHPH
jgi:uncharacterized membrane protein